MYEIFCDGLDAAGVATDAGGYVPIDQDCRTNVPHIYAAGDLSGKLPLSSVASMQGRRIAEHAMGVQSRSPRQLDYDKAASAIFTVPTSSTAWPAFGRKALVIRNVPSGMTTFLPVSSAA